MASAARISSGPSDARARPDLRLVERSVPVDRDRPRGDFRRRRPAPGPRADRADRGSRPDRAPGRASRAGARGRAAARPSAGGGQDPALGRLIRLRDRVDALGRGRSRGRTPCGPRRGALPGLGAHRRGRDRGHRGLRRAGAVAQPGQPQGHPRGARAPGRRRAAGRGVRHRVPLEPARGGVPVRDPLPVLPAVQGPPVRVPRHVPPLRGLSLPQAARHPARTGTDRHAAPRQRLLGLRDPARRLDRHLDGLHAARGSADGHALGRPRRLAARVPGAQGRDVTRRDRARAQQAVGAARDLRA